MSAYGGSRKTPVVVHRVIYGSLERFLGILIEHVAGAFPLWLSPTQVKVLPIGEGHIEYSKKVFETLRAENIRVELDDSNESLGKKIRNEGTTPIYTSLHKGKEGTPTMGGVLIWATVALVAIGILVLTKALGPDKIFSDYNFLTRKQTLFPL